MPNKKAAAPVGQPCPRCGRIVGTAGHLYNHSAAGKARMRRYLQSEKGRAAQLRYEDERARRRLAERGESG